MGTNVYTPSNIIKVHKGSISFWTVKWGYDKQQMSTGPQIQ